MAKRQEEQPLPPADRKTLESQREHDAEREAYEATLDERQRPNW